MVRELQLRFDRLLGIVATSHRDEALAVERFHALQRQIPLLYVMLLINLVGLNLSLAAPGRSPFNWGNALAAILLGRLVYWVALRGRMLEVAQIQSELRRAFIITGAFCIAYCWWSLSQYQLGRADERLHIILFASLAAIGCSFALNAFLAAARLPLFLLALPICLQMLVDGDPAHVGMGLCLVLLIALSIRLTAVHNERFINLVYSRSDIEHERERAAAAEKLAQAEHLRARQIAETDFLTGIANRRAFLSNVETLAQLSQGNIAVALLDLDGFKPINDTFGHATGDEVLIEVSRRLQGAIGTKGSVARLGGDEFALLLKCESVSMAQSECRRVVATIEAPMTLIAGEVSISASVGVSFHGGSESELGQALRRADIALYSAKRAGKGQVALFTAEMERGAQRRSALEHALRAPVEEQMFDLAFQPILDLHTMELRSFEALARWRHWELGLISPSEFIPITEQISVITELSAALLANAARQAQRWPDWVRLSFNLSAVELSATDCAKRVLAIIAQAGLPPSRLQIEVTETALLADFRIARRNLQHLRERGVMVLLDDFGAGYASISYLREMDFDKVKLDGSLITAVGTKQGRALLTGVLRLCESVGLPCVAEHVETTEQIALLRDLGCRLGQGYALARPMGADAAAHFATGMRPLKRFSSAA